MMPIVTQSAEDTREFACRFARLCFAGCVIALWGELGAGKTEFVKGLAEGLGAVGRVRSPSFELLHEHPGALSLYHFDLYRLSEAPGEDGFEEYFYGSGVCAVEWPQMAGAMLPEARVDVHITRRDDGTRSISVEPHGAQYARFGGII